MKRALLSASAALLLLAGLVGCGDDEDADPAVETTPVVSTAPSSGSDDAGDDEVLSPAETTCKDEIVRQMSDPTQETDDTPPECEGISDSRILELAAIADGEVKSDA